MSIAKGARGRLLIGLFACGASFALHSQIATLQLELLADLDARAMTRDHGASIHPELYSVRGGGILALGSPEFRGSEDEPFARPTDLSGRVSIPAERVRGNYLPVQVRYRTLFGRERTTWFHVDVRPALSISRTLYLHEGQFWAEVVDVGGGTPALRFVETTDDVATVSYTIDRGAETKLPRGVEAVTLASKPAEYTIIIRTIDGRVTRQRLVRGPDGTYQRMY